MRITLAAISVMVLVWLAFWLLVARPAHKINRRRARSKPLKHVDSNHCHLSSGALNRLTYRFIEGEDEVHWANRQHPIVFWSAAGLWLTLAVFGAVTAIWLAAHPMVFHYTTTNLNQVRSRHAIDLRWLSAVGLIVAILGAFMAWLEWLKWRAVYRLVTNRHLILINQPWAWAFWLRDNGLYDPQPLTAIVSVAPQDETAGRIFEYGTVRVKVPSMEAPDAALDIHYQPDYEEFATRLDNLRAEAKEGGSS